jgi:hypothetical protein
MSKSTFAEKQLSKKDYREKQKKYYDEELDKIIQDPDFKKAKAEFEAIMKNYKNNFEKINDRVVELTKKFETTQKPLSAAEQTELKTKRTSYANWYNKTYKPIEDEYFKQQQIMEKKLAASNILKKGFKNEPGSFSLESIENHYINIKKLLYLDDNINFDTINQINLDTESIFSEDIVDRFSEKYEKTIYSPLFNIDDIVEERGGLFTGYRSEYPDFFGFSVGSVFPYFFSYIKGLLKKLQKFNENESTFSLTEEFELLIAPINEFIDDIESIIRTIDAIIDFIDAILSISFSYLAISSGGGIEDISNQLQNAKGFPNEDKRQVIFGAFLGAGTIDPNTGAFDLSGYFKEASKEFDEETKDLFRDLNLSNEEMGLSFLNKILKPPEKPNTPEGNFFNG